MTCQRPVPVPARLVQAAGPTPGGDLKLDLGPRLLAAHITPGVAAELTRLLHDASLTATRHRRAA